jgi:hypothetical protein
VRERKLEDAKMPLWREDSVALRKSGFGLRPQEIVEHPASSDGVHRVGGERETGSISRDNHWVEARDPGVTGGKPRAVPEDNPIVEDIQTDDVGPRGEAIGEAD